MLIDRSNVDSRHLKRLWLIGKGKQRPTLAAGGNEKGLLTEPLSSCADQDLDQSLKRPRTPTRELPPRLSLPKLRG